MSVRFRGMKRGSTGMGRPLCYFEEVVFEQVRTAGETPEPLGDSTVAPSHSG